MAQGHGERAERSEPIEEGEGAQVAEDPKVTAAKANAPSEDELRKARDVVARAKAAGVKLTSTGAGGQARIMLPNGESRKAYILRRWKAGASRALILKEIQSAGAPHDKCTYQIVFSATKDQEGGPPKVGQVTEGGEAVSLVPQEAAAE